MIVLCIISFLLILTTYIASKTFSEVKVFSEYECLQFKVWYIPIAILIILVTVGNVAFSLVWVVNYFVDLHYAIVCRDVKIKGFWNKKI